MPRQNGTTNHGMSKTRQFWIWNNMRVRCQKKYDHHYKDYGGRGIKVCDHWMKFINFWEDMKLGYADNLTIDRIDNNGNYEPSNCRWATKKQQMNNYRRNHFITYKGIKKTLTEWSEIVGIKQSTIRMRISNYKWSLNDALTKGATYPIQY